MFAMDMNHFSNPANERGMPLLMRPNGHPCTIPTETVSLQGTQATERCTQQCLPDSMQNFVTLHDDDRPWGLLLSEHMHRSYTSNQPNITVGRSSSCDVVLHDPRVSSIHFRISMEVELVLDRTAEGSALHSSSLATYTESHLCRDSSETALSQICSANPHLMGDGRLGTDGPALTTNVKLATVDQRGKSYFSDACEVSGTQQTTKVVRVFLEDYSTNGTYVNDVKVDKGCRVELTSGDDIAVVCLSEKRPGEINEEAVVELTGGTAQGQQSSPSSRKTHHLPSWMTTMDTARTYLDHFYFHKYPTIEEEDSLIQKFNECHRYGSTEGNLLTLRDGATSVAPQMVEPGTASVFGEGQLVDPALASSSLVSNGVLLTGFVTAFPNEISKGAQNDLPCQLLGIKQNSVVGSYSILKRREWQWGHRVGSGGSGDVYLGMDVQSGRMIAVKVMRGTATYSEVQGTASPSDTTEANLTVYYLRAAKGTDDATSFQSEGRHECSLPSMNEHVNRGNENREPVEDESINSTAVLSPHLYETNSQGSPQGWLPGDDDSKHPAHQLHRDTISQQDGIEKGSDPQASSQHQGCCNSSGTHDMKPASTVPVIEETRTTENSTKEDALHFVVMSPEKKQCSVQLPPSIMPSHLRELWFLTKLRHHRIVRCLGVQFEPTHGLCILMDYVAGGTLQSLIKSFGVFQENVIRVYTCQILEGLEYLEKSGVVHGDLKSANILVTEKGSVKLTDFGTSRVLQGRGDAQMNCHLCRCCGGIRCTRLFSGAPPASKEACTCGEDIPSGNSGSGQISESDTVLCGTPLYMSPELIRTQVSTAASDIWALGCIVFEMATGGILPWREVHQENVLTIVYHIGKHEETGPSFDDVIGARAHLSCTPVDEMDHTNDASDSVTGHSINRGTPSVLFMDFLQSMFLMDPLQRPSATELLRHPFITGVESPLAFHRWRHHSSCREASTPSSVAIPSTPNTLTACQPLPPPFNNTGSLSGALKTPFAVSPRNKAPFVQPTPENSIAYETSTGLTKNSLSPLVLGLRDTSLSYGHTLDEEIGAVRSSSTSDTPTVEKGSRGDSYGRDGDSTPVLLGVPLSATAPPPITLDLQPHAPVVEPSTGKDGVLPSKTCFDSDAPQPWTKGDQITLGQSSHPTQNADSLATQVRVAAGSRSFRTSSHYAGRATPLQAHRSYLKQLSKQMSRPYPQEFIGVRAHGAPRCRYHGGTVLHDNVPKGYYHHENRTTLYGTNQVPLIATAPPVAGVRSPSLSQPLSPRAVSYNYYSPAPFSVDATQGSYCNPSANTMPGMNDMSYIHMAPPAQQGGSGWFHRGHNKRRDGSSSLPINQASEIAYGSSVGKEGRRVRLESSPGGRCNNPNTSLDFTNSRYTGGVNSDRGPVLTNLPSLPGAPLPSYSAAVPGYYDFRDEGMAGGPVGYYGVQLSTSGNTGSPSPIKGNEIAVHCSGEGFITDLRPGHPPGVVLSGITLEFSQLATTSKRTKGRPLRSEKMPSSCAATCSSKGRSIEGVATPTHSSQPSVLGEFSSTEVSIKTSTAAPTDLRTENGAPALVRGVTKVKMAAYKSARRTHLRVKNPVERRVKKTRRAASNDGESASAKP